jgi:hypothetical protein
MARRKRQEAWDHTAAVLALLANCHRDTKRRPRPYSPADFHPLQDATPRRRSKRKPDPLLRQMLAELMTGRKLPRPPGRWDKLETTLGAEHGKASET